MDQARIKTAIGFVTGLWLCLAGPASSVADEPQTPSPASDYRIGVEDVLDITVRNNADLTKILPVRPDGKISLPLINDVNAAGLTPMELRDALAEKFAAFIHNPDVSVVVREIHSLKVSVIGNVRMPGRYDLKGPSTVFDALALASGLNDFAARRKITVLRREGTSQERLQFDYDAALKDGRRNLIVKAGDIIVVP
jgi:polysaccharide export outer membrane protein